MLPDAWGMAPACCSLGSQKGKALRKATETGTFTCRDGAGPHPVAGVTRSAVRVTLAGLGGFLLWERAGLAAPGESVAACALAPGPVWRRGVWGPTYWSASDLSWIAPSATRDAISGSVSPASARISLVCSPSPAGWRSALGLCPSYRIGNPGIMN